MSGQAIGQIIGTVIGYTIGGPIGGMIGGTIGGYAGSSFDSLPSVQGPRMSDLKAQSSEYGRPIPIAYGTMGTAGNVIEAEYIREVSTTTEQGGKGGPSQEVTEYTYFQNFAVVVCEGEADVLRIWAGPDKRLIYDGFVTEGGSIRIYRGTEDQLPDPMLEQLHGVGNVPAYRGWCYVVFEDYPLANDLNRTPFLTFEVSTGGQTIGENYLTIEGKRLYDPAPQHVHTHSGEIARGSAQDPTDGMLYVTRREDGVTYLDKIDLETGLVGSVVVGDGSSCIMALNPLDRTVAVYASGTTYKLVDLDTFTASTATTPGGFAKADVIYVEGYGLAWLNYFNEYVDGVAHNDNWGRIGAVAGGLLIDCAGQVAAVSLTQAATIDGLSIGHNKAFEVYDPVARRLISFSDRCYFDLDTSTLTTTAQVTDSPYNLTYNPYIRRIVGLTSSGMALFDPSTFSESEGFTAEVIAFGGAMLYSSDPDDAVNSHFSLTPVNLPNMRTHMAFVDRQIASAPEGDIFLFQMGGAAGGALLSEIVSDLCDRAGLAEYDVSELTDTVDGYIVARQTEVRAAIDVLRTAYYFDAVESGGAVRFVKRGGSTVTEIPDEDLCAHEPGSEPGDPLKTTRIQEVELPRSVTVSYMQAATEYSVATKTAQRLIGSSEDLVTLDLPIVMSDTKAQEVAEVNLHAAWGQRLQYEFATTRKWSHLEPTDLVLVKGNLMRIVKCNATPFGIYRWQAVSDETAYYAPHVVVTETPTSGKTVYTPGETVLAVM